MTRVSARAFGASGFSQSQSGFTFAAIGVELGVTGEAARQAVNRALEATGAEIGEAADRFRALESARLDAAPQALWEKEMAAEIRAGRLFDHAGLGDAP